MISTDGRNKDSPIKVKTNFYDQGYGSQYNSEIRFSGAVENTSKKETLKKVTVKMQLVDTQSPPTVVKEWKSTPGDLKPNQIYQIPERVDRNTLGTKLDARLLVELEEVPKVKDEKPAAP